MLDEYVKLNGLYTDFYELTMAQGFFKTNRHLEEAVFDYFFRKNPFNGNFVVFAGTKTLQTFLKQFTYGGKQTAWLKEQGFDSSFLNWLGSSPLDVHIEAPPEGTPVFPFEPVMQIKGPLARCLLLETIILNIINFESLIATKAARMKSVMKPGQKLIDFGLRRAHGLAGVHASRAAIIGGCDSSSNVFSAAVHNHASGGTHAHAWIQSFESELDAFSTYAQLYPDSCILLVDTYDTLRIGVPSAIKTAKRLEQKGHKLLGVRVDSGDFTKIVPQTRKMLNEAGLDYVKIVVSDNIDEYRIREMNEKGVPADIFGVGTRLITAKDDAALGGVYKISSLSGRPLIKVSDDAAKMSLPGMKKLYRAERENHFSHDLITCDDEPLHLHNDYTFRPVRTVQYKAGEELRDESLEMISKRRKEQLSKLDPDIMRLGNKGQAYEVVLSEKLATLQRSLARKHKQNNTEN